MVEQAEALLFPRTLFAPAGDESMLLVGEHARCINNTDQLFCLQLRGSLVAGVSMLTPCPCRLLSVCPVQE
jgi:hypothetical protein